MGNVRMQCWSQFPERLENARREVQAALAALSDELPNSAMRLIERARSCGRRVKEFHEIVMSTADPVLTAITPRPKYDEVLARKLITLTAMGARLERYILGHGGPVDRSITSATMAAVSVELTKENKCALKGSVRYPQDNTVDLAFASFLLAVWQVFDCVQKNRGCYRG